MHGFIQDIGLAFLVATFLGLITQKLRQPIILGYFIAGIIIGPEIGPKLVSDPANIDTITGIGLVLLLFVIGLEMDVTKIVRAGKQMLVAGVGQFGLCVGYGLLLFGFLGYGLRGCDLTGLYFALLCALSSTAIVVKILYDKFELDTLHGRITVGVLVMQDIWAVMILAFQPNLNRPELLLFAMALLKCVALVGTTYFLSKYVMSRIFRGVAKLPEIVIVTSLGWCAFGAGLAGYLGLSMEMGALVAGVTISMFQYKTFVTGRVLPLRDFFLTLFFVSLGMKIPYPSKSMLLLALGLGGFIVATRFMSVYPLLVFTGSGRRTAFISSMNLSQLSEFSLVIAALGISYKHIEPSSLGALIYTMALTAIGSSYLIQYSHRIFTGYAWLLRTMGLREAAEAAEAGPPVDGRPLVILGFHRGAQAVIEAMHREHPELLSKTMVVDFNPESLKDIRSRGVAALYGDISNMETLERANIHEARVILSTIPDMLLKGTTNSDLVRLCRSMSPKAYIVATADFRDQVQELTTLGANEVLSPHSLVGRYLVPVIKTHMGE